MKKARAISPDGIIGYNVMTALKEHARSHKGGCQSGRGYYHIRRRPSPQIFRRLTEGSSTKIAPIVSTDKSANVILKYWDRKYKRTADLVVIEGPQREVILDLRKRNSRNIHRKPMAEKYSVLSGP